MRVSALIILGLGLVVAGVSHQLYYRAQVHEAKAVEIDYVAWMKDEFSLTEAQFNRIRELHDSRQAIFGALGQQLLETQQRWNAMDLARRESRPIDFLEVYAVNQRGKALEEESRQATRELIEAVGAVMNDEQRSHYYALLQASGSTVQPEGTPHRKETGRTFSWPADA